MAEIVKITKDQPFALYVPLVILNADGSKESVDASALTNTTVTIQRACEDPQEVLQKSAFEHFLILQFEAGLTVGEYAMLLTATLPTGRQFTLRFKRAFAIVEWDCQSNWRDYLVGDHIELTDQPFIAGYGIPDAEYDALKAELRAKIAEFEEAKTEADAAKAAWEQNAQQLDDVAKETTSQQILSAVGGVSQQGSDPNATNTAIYQLIEQEGIPRANEYSAEIREIIGDWSQESESEEQEITPNEVGNLNEIL